MRRTQAAQCNILRAILYKISDERGAWEDAEDRVASQVLKCLMEKNRPLSYRTVALLDASGTTNLSAIEGQRH